MESKVLIRKPCSQNLDRMPRTATGVFCTVCSEHVVDVSRFTGEELTGWIAANAKTKPCGIYTPQQAKVPFLQRLSMPFRYAALSTLSFFAVKESAAQTAAAIPAAQPDTIRMPADTQVRRISGRVVSRLGKKPMGSVVVSVTGADSLIGFTVTQPDGTYDLALPATTDTSYTISFTRRGYDMEVVFGYVPCDKSLDLAMKKADWKRKRNQRRVVSKF